MLAINNKALKTRDAFSAGPVNAASVYETDFRDIGIR